MLAALAVLAASACAAPAAQGPVPGGAGSPPDGAAAERDTSGLVPPGYGSLRQDDVALRLEVEGVEVKLIPLHESVIRLLSPDSYRALHDLAASRAPELARLASVHGLRERNVWLASFYGLMQEARFAPTDVTVSAPGRDARPVAVLPLTNGFGEQRVRARETQSALLLLDDGVDLTQPFSVQMGNARTTAWTDVLRLLERERALVRARARRR